MMRLFDLRPLFAAGLLSIAASTASAQQPTNRPTAEQARALLVARPELVDQLRQRLLSSGLTKEQIHARLRAEGYPENVLDPYLPGGTGDIPAPTADVYNA